MKIPPMPFTMANWSGVTPTVHPGVTGQAIWRTFTIGDLRVRRVEHAAGYRADRWCDLGHVLYVLEGELDTELRDERKFKLLPGMSYQVSDDGDAHIARRRKRAQSSLSLISAADREAQDYECRRGDGMKAYCIDHFGSVDGVVLQSRADPQPVRREILIRVRATSLNYRDLMVLKGGGRGPTKVGVVPLSDGAGEVVALGDGVTRFAAGDRVIGCFHPRWFGGPIKADYLTDRLGANLDGMLAEYAVVSEEAAVPVPDDLSFEEAATLPCAGVTAWVALTRHQRGVTAGDTVLTQGSGGVSIFALQFARLLGAQVIATTSSAEKAERLKALGAAAGSIMSRRRTGMRKFSNLPAAKGSTASSRSADRVRWQFH